MTRREMLAFSTASTVATLNSASAQDPQGKALLGGSPTCFSVRAKAAKNVNQLFDIVEHCHQLGLAGAEVSQFAATPDAAKLMRQKVDSYGMLLVLNIPLPKKQDDVARFESAVISCKDAGAIALHAAMTNRRYEQFNSLSAFKLNFAQCQLSVELAEPVLRKHRLRLAIENHKGWRAAEQAAWMNRLSSEWVGVCLDMGNNLSLCEMPDDTFAALLPFAIFSHIKDMGLEDYTDGFLLSEVPFGDGVINLKERIAQLRQKDPNLLFCLEMITRDPLKIPVFTDQYWTTFSDSETEISGRDVAKVLDLVRKNRPTKPLPRVDSLSPDDRLKAEDAYNMACINYARRNLNM